MNTEAPVMNSLTDRQDGVKVFSFDIFDTTLTRVVAAPRDIFFLMKSELDPRALGLPPGLRENFPYERINAETEARYLSESGEITISDIYSRMKARFGLNEDQVEGLIQKEIEVEKRSVRPVGLTMLLIGAARGTGARVAFVSDMYLPEHVILEMLTSAGAFRQGDSIYISGHVGLSKSNGDLYKKIIAVERCSPDQICHYGDDIHSDIYIPKKLGIKVRFLTDKGSEDLLRLHMFKRSLYSLRKKLRRELFKRKLAARRRER